MKKIFKVFIVFVVYNGLFAQTVNPVKLKTGMIYPDKNIASFSPSDLKPYTYKHNIYGIMQFSHIPDRAEKETILSAGLNLLEYLPENAYLVSFNEADFRKFAEIKMTGFFTGIDPILKISPKLLQEFSSSTDRKKLMVNLKLFSTDHVSSFREEMLLKGLYIKSEKKNPEILSVNLSIKDLHVLSSHPVVCFIEKPSPPGEKEDLGARTLHRSNNIDQAFENGLKFDGSGVNVLVRDDGKIGPHIDYKGRIDQSKTIFNSNLASHGDMVSGILMGAGNLDPDVTGTAKGAFLYVTDYEPTFLDETMDLYFQNKVQITSSSYSDGCNDGYTINSLTTDKQIFENNDLIHVFSAGNSGAQDCGYGAGAGWGNITGGHKMGKNSIAVGNLNQDGIIENSSSRGPASDGRIKPDICANGAGQLSTYPDNTIDFGGGTSAAAPGISGVLAQLNQAYKTLNNNESPPSALLKACLLNTANDLGQTGPDYIYGWGQVNARKAYELIKEKRFQKIMLAQGDSTEIKLNIPANTSNLKVMIYWADKESSLLSSTALVNDIDMSATSPSGSILLPYVLNSLPNAALLSLPATNGIDHINNMEQIEISNPASGEYTIRLKGHVVPFEPAEAWFVYQIDNNTPILTYPNGGESFKTGEIVKIQWDAITSNGNFILDYSIDQGNSWNFIKSVSGNLRRTTWIAPSMPLDSVYLRISRNGMTNQTTAPFIILDNIDSVSVDKICPQTASIFWNEINGAEKYVIFELGEKYMVPFDTVSSTNFSFSNYPGTERWVSVMPLSKSGMPGKRSIARKLYKLYNCPQPTDLSVKVDTLFPMSKIFCEEDIQPLTAVFANEGLDTIFGFSLYYKIGNGPINKKIISNPIPPGLETNISFDSLDVNTSIQSEITVWGETPGESAFYNDTLKYTISYQVQNLNGTDAPYLQTFDQNNFPPQFWSTLTDDIQVNWDTVTCIGAYGTPTRAAWMNNFNNIVEGAHDDLLTEKFNLVNSTKAYLFFDYAYARFDQDYQDTLEISVSFDCGKTFQDKIFYKGGAKLITVNDLQTTFIPTSPDQWKTEMIDLNNYTGNIITFRFRNISGYGNSLLLDNIKVVNEIIPEAYIFEDVDKYCIGISQPLELNAKLFPTATYKWNFGEGAIPQEAIGPGPHLVSYSTPGVKSVQLIVSAGNKADTTSLILTADPITDAKFYYNKNGKIVEFNPLQQNVSSKHFWNFGDGEMSQEINPVHIYATNGNYNVLHLLKDDCGEDEHYEAVIVTSLQSPESNPFNVFPNPANDHVEIRTSDNLQRIFLQNSLGLQQKISIDKNQYGYVLSLQDTPAGMYFLVLHTSSEKTVYKLNIIKE